ncbi:hypothetical protein ABEF94_008831 [Exophiala dermatitidis]
MNHSRYMSLSLIRFVRRLSSSPSHGSQGQGVSVKQEPQLQTPWLAPAINIDLLFPRHRFGSSRFNAIVLLFLRLFYHAASFEAAVAATPSMNGTRSGTGSLLTHPLPRHYSQDGDDIAERPTTGPVLPQQLKSYQVLSTSAWLEAIQNEAHQYRNCRIQSISWIKALASPFSHEFIQFIVEDSVSGERTRVVAGREDSGDWVYVGWNWQSGQVPNDHYILPLPLLTLSFERNTGGGLPDLLSLAQVLASTTERQPYYTFHREMCWWYAETVFDGMFSRYGGSVKEWEWAKYRYSFIVKTSLLRRRVLTEHAERFKGELMEGMEY